MGSWIRGFEVTPDDVSIVMGNAGVEIDDEEAERIYAEHIEPRGDEIARNVHGDDVDEMTDSAYAIMTRILAEAGALPEGPSPSAA